MMSNNQVVDPNTQNLAQILRESIYVSKANLFSLFHFFLFFFMICTRILIIVNYLSCYMTQRTIQKFNEDRKAKLAEEADRVIPIVVCSLSLTHTPLRSIYSKLIILCTLTICSVVFFCHN